MRRLSNNQQWFPNTCEDFRSTNNALPKIRENYQTLLNSILSERQSSQPEFYVPNE